MLHHWKQDLGRGPRESRPGCKGSVASGFHKGEDHESSMETCPPPRRKAGASYVTLCHRRKALSLSKHGA